MKLFVTGDRDDVVAFALSGVERLPDAIPADAIVIASSGAELPPAAPSGAPQFIVVLPEPS